MADNETFAERIGHRPDTPEYRPEIEAPRPEYIAMIGGTALVVAILAYSVWRKKGGADLSAATKGLSV